MTRPKQFTLTLVVLASIHVGCWKDMNRPALEHSNTENMGSLMWNKFGNIILETRLDKEGRTWILTITVDERMWSKYDVRAKQELVDGAVAGPIRKLCRDDAKRCLTKVVTKKGSVVARAVANDITILK